MHLPSCKLSLLTSLLVWSLSLSSLGLPIHVDGNATGANDGSTWANAFTDLSSALNESAKDVEIWVAQGTYKVGPSGSDRALAFTFANRNVLVYGGFTSGMPSLTNRNPTLHATILSGDFSGDDTPAWGNRGDNAYNVVRVRSDSAVPLGDVLDGFIIRGGMADAGDGSPYSYGGGISVYNSANLRIANCVIADNAADGSGGLWLRRSANATVENCVFSGNSANLSGSHNYGSGGAGVAAQAGEYSVHFIGCRFVGNYSVEYGGAFYSTHIIITNDFRNCLFVGNLSSEAGGGLMLRNQASPVINCTFSRNAPSAIWSQGANPVATNAILWGDDSEITGFALMQYTYSDVMSSGGGGTSNLDVNPLFKVDTSATWTAAGVYNPATCLTQLTDSQASWTPGALAGGTVNPDTSQPLHYYIATNTVHTIFVWGDASVGDNGDTYSLNDWHLQTNSPCVDRGNPGMDWSQEPDYPTGHIDMGAYGNTREAASTNPVPSNIPPLPTGMRFIVR